MVVLFEEEPSIYNIKTTMKKVIFLDIDGVLDTEQSRRALLAEGRPWKDECGPFFDEEAVRNLRTIVEGTGAEVVITSSWRHLGEDRMQELWARRKMPGILAGITPEIAYDCYAMRGQEIAAYLAQHVEEGEACRYVIIDDGCDFLPEQIPFCVFTDPDVGITDEDAQKAVIELKRVL